MTILVDPAVWAHRGRRWAHLVSDHSYEELHTFAARLGLERAWFQGDHYDIPAAMRVRAIDLGAEPVPGRELVRRLRTAGLRRRRRGPGRADDAAYDGAVMAGAPAARGRAAGASSPGV